MAHLLRLAPVAALLLVAVLCWPEEGALKLSTQRDGNLIPYGEPVSVAVEAPGAATVSWRLTDYAEAELRRGETPLNGGRGTLELGVLPHGYYEVHCQAGAGTARLTLGVITDHSGQDPPSGRLNVDAALSWLVPQEQYEPLAHMLRMAGVAWVRERFSWADIEGKRGQVDWKQYDTIADTWTRYGIRVYQVFHDSPAWSHPASDKTRNPDDLRDVYTFARRLAEHYKGRVRAWEVWNEPDIDFWPDLGDTYAGLAKAAYLGFKAGDPDLLVLLGSFCRGYCNFDESLFEAGIADYFDVFNWHIYNDPLAYADVLRRYLELLGRFGCGERPVWLTEAGIFLPHTEPGGELSPANERRQAEFVPKSFACSLAAGTDRHFFFIYPYYQEGHVQFGSLHKDLSPRPGFIALAAAVDILGQARYLGRWDFPEGSKCYGFAFDNGTQRVLVAWAAEQQQVTLEVGAGQVELANIVGRRLRVNAPGGVLSVDLGPTPQYIIGLGNAALAHLGGEVRPPGRLPTAKPDPLVVRGQARVDTLEKAANAYVIGDEPFGYAVEVCNFSDSLSARGSVALEPPEGWTCEPAGLDVSLEPMARAVVEFTVRPGKPTGGLVKLWVRPTFEGFHPAPAVSQFRRDPARVTPAEVFDLSLNDPALWTANISENGVLERQPGPEGGVRFVIKYTRAGDRWCYPSVSFDPPRDFSAWDGICFEYRCQADDGETIVHFQAWEPGGSAYINGDTYRARKDWTRAACLFADLTWGAYSAPDMDGKLDTSAIKTLMVGLNTPRDDLWLEVRNVRLFRF